MSSVSDFLQENVSNEPVKKEIKFEGFKSPFVIKALTATELNDLTKRNTKKKFDKKNRTIVTETDQDKLVDDMVVQSVVSPELENEQLQKSWGVIAKPADLLRKMLLAGQFAELVKEVTDLSGFDTDDVDDLIGEVKN